MSTTVFQKRKQNDKSNVKNRNKFFNGNAPASENGSANSFSSSIGNGSIFSVNLGRLSIVTGPKSKEEDDRHWTRKYLRAS